MPVSLMRSQWQMSPKWSETSHNRYSPEHSKAEMQGHLRQIVDISMERNRKAALNFAAQSLRMSYDRVRSIFYGQAHRIEAHEADQIRAYVQQAEELIQARAAYEAKRAEFLASARPSLARLVPPSMDAAQAPKAPVKKRPL